MSKKTYVFIIGAVLTALLLGACSKPPPGRASGDSSSTGQDTDGDAIPDAAEATLGTDPNSPDTDGDGQNDLEDQTPVLGANPIQETSATIGFTLGGLLVENNVDAGGADAPDHLEFNVTNTGIVDLTNFDIYYTITDQTTGAVQGYYRTLPGFTLKAGETQTLHFDNTGMPNHFSVNPNSAFYSNLNGLTLEVTLHVHGFAVQTGTVNKDPGGAEGGGE